MRIFFVICVNLLVVGCSNLESRLDTAQRLAFSANFSSIILNTSTFKLQGFAKIEKPGEPLEVFIEGDGLAYVSRSSPSRNPTPIDPISLRLATISSKPNILYIARPCQYVELNSQKNCGVKIWTTSRFTEDVINAVNQAIDFGLKRAQASIVHLVGYSGGGAVAVLVAARRQNVGSIRTLAGYLDHKTLNRVKKVTPLYGSLDPMEKAYLLSHIPQHHISGSNDKIIPKWVAQGFAKAVGNTKCATAKIANTTHTDGWLELWKKIGNAIPKCRL